MTENSKAMRHENIKKNLRVAGSSISEIAAELGISPTTVTIVCQGHRVSDRVQQKIAEKLSTTAQALFPERYPQSVQND